MPYGLTIVIPREGPGDGPAEPLTWQVSSNGQVVKSAAAQATLTMPAGVTAPNGLPVMRLARTDTDTTLFAQGVSATKPSGFVLPAGKEFNIFGYARANAAGYLRLELLNPSDGSQAVMVNNPAATLTADNAWKTINLTKTAALELVNQQFRWSIRTNADGTGPHITPITLDLALVVTTAA